MKRIVAVAVFACIAFLAIHITFKGPGDKEEGEEVSHNSVQSALDAEAQLETERTIWNNVWDKANTRLMTTPGVGAQGSFETTQTILNNVWDKQNNMLKTSGGGEGGGDFSSNTSTAVDSEVILFSGTGGKTGKRATGTGVAHLTSGVLSASEVDLASEVTGVLPLANGGGLTTVTDDNIAIANGSVWQSKAIPDCTDTGGNHLNYTAATNALSCGTSGGGAGVTQTVFNVKDYGAEGDGITDDTGAIEDTFTAAGNNSVVYFPTGTYSATTITITGATGITIRGQGETSMIKRRPAGGNTGPILHIINSSSIIVEYMGIDVNNCLSFCSGIQMDTVTRFRVQHNKIIDSDINTTNVNDKFGITVQGPSEGTLDEPNYVLYNILEDTQLEIDRMSNLLVQGNKVIRPRFTTGIGFFTNAVAGSSARNVQIVDNVVQDADVSCAAICVNLDPNNQTDFTYSDFIISRNIIMYTVATVAELREGIHVGTGNTSTGTTGNIFRNFQIVGNHIWAHPSYAPTEFTGISLAGGPTPNFVFDKFTIANNTIVLPNSIGYGLNVRMLENTVIRNNSVYNVTHASSIGIATIRAKHLQVLDNEVYGTGGIGINFVVVPAYDVDVHSRGNKISGVTTPYIVEDTPPAGYYLEDFQLGAGSTQDPATAGEIVRTWAGTVGVDLATMGAVTTMTGTPTLVAGVENQRVSIVNVGAHVITFQSDAVLAGSDLFLRDPVVRLNTNEMLTLVYHVSVGGWIQEGPSRQTARMVTLTNDETVPVNAATTDIGVLNNLTVATTILNPTGSPVNGQYLAFRITTTAPRTLTWDTQYVGNSGVALPAATSGGSLVDYYEFRYNANTTTWDILRSGNIATATSAQTLTNKRITPRALVMVDAATVTPNVDTQDIGILSTLSQATLIDTPTGTPVEGQGWLLRITSGTTRALTWGAIYAATATVALPSDTTGGGAVDYFSFRYNAVTAKFDLVSTTAAP